MIKKGDDEYVVVVSGQNTGKLASVSGIEFFFRRKFYVKIGEKNNMQFAFSSAYRCCYCHYWNPARKQRPTAPKLEASSTLRTQASTESSSSDEGTV